MKARTGLALVLCAMTASCDRHPTAPAPREYRVGDHHDFNVQFGDGLLCSASGRDLREGRVAAVSDRAVVVADVGNPPGGYTDDDYAALAGTFDRDVWPTLTHNFGTPHDIDGNGRVVLFFTRAVNELAPPGQPWFVGGVFAARDLFPTRDTRRLRGCAGSNHAELIYMPVPDPAGQINGHVRGRTSELRNAPALMAHELQHVINASVRLYGGRTVPSDWYEATWLNEGLSHVAEELMAYATGELAPRQNVGIEEFIGSSPLQNAFSRFVHSNFHWLADYLGRPDTASLYGPDSRATRGSAWQFLRYAADRRGGSEAAFWRGLVAPGRTGFDNLGRALHAEPMDWIHDWLVAVYVDDAVAGVHPRFTQPSWNFRSLYPFLSTPDGASYDRYPLATQALANGRDVSLSLPAGGAAYLRFGVPAGGRGEIRTSATAGSCLAGGPSHALGVGEVLTLTASQAAAVCVEGGGAGAEFAYIPFFAALSGIRALDVRGSGLVPPSQPPSPSRSVGHPREGTSGGRAWETAFRVSEQRELAALVGTAAHPAQPASTYLVPGGGAHLRVAIVRTR